MFRYICVILREFRRCTVPKFLSFCIIKISFIIITLKYACGCCWCAPPTPNAPTTCPCGLRGPPSWAFQQCNRLLRLGRPWGAVTLSRWCEWWYRRMECQEALKSKFYQPTQNMVTSEILPFKENSHGRGGNRTRGVIISSQRLWPLDREADL